MKIFQIYQKNVLSRRLIGFDQTDLEANIANPERTLTSSHHRLLISNIVKIFHLNFEETFQKFIKNVMSWTLKKSEPFVIEGAKLAILGRTLAGYYERVTNFILCVVLNFNLFENLSETSYHESQKDFISHIRSPNLQILTVF